MSQQQSPGTSEHLGEAGILARLLTHVPGGDRVEVGPGDDAAVVDLPGTRLVITTDTMVEGFDFLAHTTCPRWIGHKAAVQNLADVAAMGARPIALVAAVSTPAGTPADWFEQVTEGLTRRAGEDGAQLVGGDLGRADRPTLTITAVGALREGERAVLRSGARPGDVLAIGSPALGRSAAGLAAVLSGRVQVKGDGTVVIAPGAGGTPAPSSHHATTPLDPALITQLEGLVAWHNAPDPDLSLGWTSGRAATAMMDLSDGLVRDGGRIAVASGVQVDLDATALGGDVDALAVPASVLDADPWDWVLHGGEEHAMLATFAPGAVPQGFRVIGVIREHVGQPAPRVLLDGEPITGEGFDHFGWSRLIDHPSPDRWHGRVPK